MIAFEPRAATVLYNLVVSHQETGPFLLPANVCPIVPIVFLKARRPFEFLDISPETLCLDRDAVVSRWRDRSRPVPAGLIFVRTYGAVFDESPLFATIKSMSPSSLIVDDRCLCRPETEVAPAADCDAVLFSTGYAKYVDLGFGGYGFLRDGVPYGRSRSGYSPSALSEVTALYKRALSDTSTFEYQDVPWLDTTEPEVRWKDYSVQVMAERAKADAVKAAINAIYTTNIDPELQMTKEFQSWRFNLRVGDKSAMLDRISRSGLFASGHYQPLVPTFGAGKAPVAARVHESVVNLFNDRYFDPDKARQICELIADHRPIARRYQLT